MLTWLRDSSVNLKLAITVLTAFACASSPKVAARNISEPSCPRLGADSSGPKTALDDSIALSQARKYPKFVSIIVDGKRAAWNYPMSMMSENTSFGIKRGEIKSMRGVDWEEAARVYGTCPGVSLILVETKSGNWQPPPSKSRG